MELDLFKREKIRLLSFGIIVIVLLVILVFMVPVFTGKVIEPKIQRIILAENVVAVVSAPLYVAEEKGFWAEEGLSVEVMPFTSGKLSLDALLGEKADIASVAETPIMFASLKGGKFLIAGTISKEFYTIAARRDSEIRLASDIRNKKIATVKGSAGEYALSTFLNANNVGIFEIEFIPLDAQYFVPALSNKDIDGFVWVDPLIYYARQSLGENFIEFSVPEYTEYFNIVVRKDFLDKNPEAVRKFVKGLIQSEDFIKNNRNEAISIVSKKLAIREDDLDKIWDSLVFEIRLEQGFLKQIEDEAKWAIESGYAKDAEIPNFCEIIHTDTLRELKPESIAITCS